MSQSRDSSSSAWLTSTSAVTDGGGRERIASWTMRPAFVARWRTRNGCQGATRASLGCATAGHAARARRAIATFRPSRVLGCAAPRRGGGVHGGVGAAKLRHERDAERAAGDPGLPRRDVPGSRALSGRAISGRHSRSGAGSSSTMLSTPPRSCLSAATIAAAASSAWMNEENPAAGADDRELASADLRGRCAAGSVRAARSA